METSIEIKELNNRIRQIENENVLLQEMNAKKDKLFTSIAHDLRSPFQSLLGLSEILSTEAVNLTSEEVIKYSRILNKEIRNQYEFLKQIFDWAQLQSGKMTFTPKQLNLYDIVMEVCFNLKPAASGKNISLITEITKESHVYADEEMLSIMLQNLISNAIKYSNRGNEVNILFKETKDYCEVTVSDKGIGMSPEMIEKILRFDSKHSLPGTENEKGSGLGLMMVHDMIKKHNGKLFAESKVNEGSKFTFALPVIPS